VYWCLRVETRPCGNVVSAVLMFCLRFGRHGSINWTAWSSRDMCVNWNEPQLSRLQLYEQPSALNDAWVRAGAYKQRSPKGQSRTCYQECSCYLNPNNIISIMIKWNLIDRTSLTNPFCYIGVVGIVIVQRPIHLSIWFCNEELC